jgi:hypothetical protein
MFYERGSIEHGNDTLNGCRMSNRVADGCETNPLLLKRLRLREVFKAIHVKPMAGDIMHVDGNVLRQQMLEQRLEAKFPEVCAIAQFLQRVRHKL